MNSLKTKIFLGLKRTKSARNFFVSRLGRFFGFSRKRRFDQSRIDRQLVYGLATRKLPSSRQLKHLKKFLNPKEYTLVKVCSLLILVNLVYLGIVFLGGHLQYLPVAGGTYTEGTVGYPKNINPLYASNRDIDSDLASLIYSSLFKYNSQGQLVSDLAETTAIGGDDKEYTIKIKDNVRWHTGEKLTADDVVFTFNLINNPDYRSPLRNSLSSVAAEKIDDLTIKFTLSEKYAPFPELLTFGIMPKSAWENISANSAALSDLNIKPIGSGPYKFKSLIRNTNGDLKEYNLEVNNDYYGHKPYIKNVIFKFFAEYPEMIKAFNNNQLDGLSYLPFAERKELLAPDSVLFHELVRPQIMAVFFNRDKDKVLDNKAVRIALAQAIDKDQIIKDVFAGIYQRADGPIMPQNFTYNNQITKYSYAPAEAAMSLSGKLSSTTLSVVDSGNNVAVAARIKSYWEAAGVQVSLRVIPSEQAAETIKNRDFESLLYGEAIGGDPDVYAFWHSSQSGGRGLNLGAYNNQEVDRLLSEGRTATDISVRLEKYQKFQEVLTADAPAIFLYSPTYTYIQNKNIKGFTGTVAIDPLNRLADISDWYIKTTKKIMW